MLKPDCFEKITFDLTLSCSGSTSSVALCTGPEMRQISGACSPGQQRNMKLCSQLQEVHRSLLTLLPRMQPPAAAALM